MCFGRWLVLSSYSRIAWNRALLSFLGQCPAQTGSCCQRWQHHLPQSKHKYRENFVSKIKVPWDQAANQQTDKCAARCTPQSLEKLMSLVFEHKSSPCAEAQGVGQTWHWSSCYWAMCWHSNQAEPQNHGTVWAGRDLRINPTPLSWAGTFSPRPDCSKPHHKRQILQRELCKGPCRYQ